MEKHEEKTKDNKVENRKQGTAGDVKRFNGAVNAILLTNLITEEERVKLTELKTNVTNKYLEN